MHTKGPWKLEAGRSVVTESGTFYVTYGKDKHRNPLWLSSFSELDANARLISAAPDMLAALKWADDALAFCAEKDGDINFWNEGGVGYEAKIAVTSAIAKAERR